MSIFTAIQSGYADDPNTWGGHGVPGPEDIVDLKGHTITQRSVKQVRQLLDTGELPGALHLTSSFACTVAVDAQMICNRADQDGGPILLTLAEGLPGLRHYRGHAAIIVGPQGKVGIKGDLLFAGEGIGIQNDGIIAFLAGTVTHIGPGWAIHNGKRAIIHRLDSTIYNLGNGVALWNYGTIKELRGSLRNHGTFVGMRNEGEIYHITGEIVCTTGTAIENRGYIEEIKGTMFVSRGVAVANKEKIYMLSGPVFSADKECGIKNTGTISHVTGKIVAAGGTGLENYKNTETISGEIANTGDGREVRGTPKKTLSKKHGAIQSEGHIEKRINMSYRQLIEWATAVRGRPWGLEQKKPRIYFNLRKDATIYFELPNFPTGDKDSQLGHARLRVWWKVRTRPPQWYAGQRQVITRRLCKEALILAALNAGDREFAQIVANTSKKLSPEQCDVITHLLAHGDVAAAKETFNR